MKCSTCKRPVDPEARVTLRYTLGSRRPPRIVSCPSCERPSIERATDRLAHDLERIYDVLPVGHSVKS